MLQCVVKMRRVTALICCAVLVSQVYARFPSGDNRLQTRSLLATSVPAGSSCSTTDTCVVGAQCVGATDSASGMCTANATQVSTVKVASSTEKQVPAVTSVATLPSYLTTDAFNDNARQTFILTLQTNIRAKVNAIVNVNIDKVALGSILVTNTATFTDANSDTATAGQTALAKVLNSGDLTGIFGTQYGDVTVGDINTAYSGNPTLSGAARANVTTWALLAVLVAVISAVIL